MRAKRLASMNQQPKSANAVKSTTASIQKQEPKSSEKMSQREFFKKIGKSRTGN